MESGYKRAPKATQFKRGCSGNPKGRPKGVRSLKAELKGLMEKRVRIRADGEQRQVTRQRLMLLKFFEKAANGDIRALTQMMNMAMKLEASDPMQSEPDIVTDNDRAIVEEFFRQNSPSNEGEQE